MFWSINLQNALFGRAKTPKETVESRLDYSVCTLLGRRNRTMTSPVTQNTPEITVTLTRQQKRVTNTDGPVFLDSWLTKFPLYTFLAHYFDRSSVACGPDPRVQSTAVSGGPRAWRRIRLGRLLTSSLPLYQPADQRCWPVTLYL